MKVVLIWEMIPEPSEVFVIEDPSEEDLKILESANNRFINLDEPEDVKAVLLISDMICSNPIGWVDKDNENNGAWASYKSGFPVNGPIDKIFSCGWIQ